MNNYKYIAFLILLVVRFSYSQTQVTDTTKLAKPPIKGFICKAVVVDGDTIPEIYLRETAVAAEKVFSSPEEAERYRKLVRDVKKVYPQAIRLSAKVSEYNIQVSKLPKREKKAYMKKIEPEVRTQFEKAFRSNTVKQAQILIKLIDRETGKSSHELIKYFKGGWSAFMWQSLAMVVGTNLKEEYLPEGEDAAIEKIVKAIEAGTI